MAEYVAFDENVEVHGNAVSTTIEVLGEEAIPILKKHGLYPIDPEKWYDQQTQLNVYRDVSQLNLLTMVAVGMRVPDFAEFPPHIQTVEDALALLDKAYQMNHRGGEIGSYVFKKIDDRSAKMVCHNPYPSDFDYGLIYRLVQKYRPADSNKLIVEVDPNAPTRKNGADSCTYLIQW